MRVIEDFYKIKSLNKIKLSFVELPSITLTKLQKKNYIVAIQKNQLK